MTNRKNWIDTRYIVPERERERAFSWFVFGTRTTFDYVAFLFLW